jgi:hypothetical protein
VSLGLLNYTHGGLRLVVDNTLLEDTAIPLPGMPLSEDELPLVEAVSKKKGDKWTFQGKTGVWRTAKSGERVFISDDGEVLGIGGTKESMDEAAKGKSAWQDKRTSWSSKERKHAKKSVRQAGKKEIARQQGEDLEAELNKLLAPFSSGDTVGPVDVTPIFHPPVLGVFSEDEQQIALQVAQAVLGEEFPGKPREHEAGLWTRLHKELKKRKGVTDPKALAGWIKSQLLKAGHTVKEEDVEQVDLETQLEQLLAPFSAHLMEREAKPEPLILRKQETELYPGNQLVVLKGHRPIVIFNSWDMQSPQEQVRMLKNALTNETGLATQDAVAKAILRKLGRGINVSVGVHKGSYVLGKAMGVVARQKATPKGQQKQTARISQRKLGAMRRVKVPQPHGEEISLEDHLDRLLQDILENPGPFDLGAPVIDAVSEAQNVFERQTGLRLSL